MSEWRECTLGDVLNLRRGYDLPHSEMKEGKVPVAGSNGMIGTHNIATDVEPCITVGRSGSAGSVFYYDRAWAHNTTLYIDDFKGNYPTYLYYLLLSLPLKKMAGGSAVPSLNRNHIHPLNILFPSNIDEQRNIAAILSSLDTKIECNRKICTNLEAQAQALFKHWFIDFAPFKDGKFIDSELGMIPEGWRVGTLGDVCIKVTDGSHFSPKDSPCASIPMLSVKDMRTYCFDYSTCKHITEEDYELLKNNDCVPLKNDILIAKDGSYLKELFICREEMKQAILSSIAIFRPNLEVISPDYLLQFLKQPKILKDVRDNYVSGTAVPRIVLKDFKKLRMCIPPKEIQNKCMCIIEELSIQIFVIQEESLRLSALRDTLLPKLMSGQIKL